ncbi:hypothetical protein EVAR_10747_1 [Eumeta japonica]|uniref:Uncharacterized protein n=1 Tax=Eumeta variegata TaxID=151549 RepID=A0A4C1W8E4_EUMVA|nr:hypothetical protein EVAR_10747_1 [Eumeta japonica]
MPLKQHESDLAADRRRVHYCVQNLCRLQYLIEHAAAEVPTFFPAKKPFSHIQMARCQTKGSFGRHRPTCLRLSFVSLYHEPPAMMMSSVVATDLRPLRRPSVGLEQPGANAKLKILIEHPRRVGVRRTNLAPAALTGLPNEWARAERDVCASDQHHNSRRGGSRRRRGALSAVRSVDALGLNELSGPPSERL